MSEVAEWRIQQLEEIDQNRESVALSLHEMHMIDNELRSSWGIEFFETDRDLEGRLEDLDDVDARERGLIALGLAERRLASPRKTGTKTDEADLYKVMAVPPLLGLVTSKRRHYILDTIALTIGLARTLNIAEPLLDIGTHAGFLPIVVRNHLSNSCVGIDPISEAIAHGKTQLPEHSDVELLIDSLPWKTDRKFGLIVALDVLPEKSVGERANFFREMGGLLTDGGVAVVVSGALSDLDPILTRRQLLAAGLGFGYADIVGGYGGAPTQFSVEGCVVLVKGSSRPYPRKITSQMERDWEIFQSYANDPATAKREKTQSFMRARRSGLNWV